MNFNPQQQYILEDDRVLLRPLEPKDLEHLSYFVTKEPEIWKYSSIPISSMADFTDYIDKAIAAREKGAEYAFIVFDKVQNQYAGCTRFYDIQPKYDTLQLGYTWYGKNYQGTGLNKHCKYLLLQLAFENFSVERVEFRADAANARSVAAMKSIGCTVEGILRSHMPKIDGSRRNSIILSILKNEWFDHIKKSLAAQL